MLLFYFLKLRRRPVRVSTVRFWVSSTEDLQVNAPFRMIRPSWLLLLHLLATGLLCAAAGRPALDKGSLGAGRVVIVIDHSASMSAVDAKPEGAAGAPPIPRLEAAKSAAIKAIEGLDAAGARAMLVSVAGRPVTRANFTRDAGALRKAVEAIEPTDQPGNLAEALHMIAAFATSPEYGEPPPTLVLITDGGLRLEPGATVPGLGSLNVRMVRVGPAPNASGDNVGIVALNARRDFRNPALLRVFVRLQSMVPAPLSVGLTCRMGDEPAQVAVVEMAPATKGEPELTPSEASRTFEFRTVAGAVLTVSLSRRDVLESDNSASLVIAPARKPAIVLVRPPGERTGADENLRSALETLEPSSLKVLTADAYRAGADPAAGEADLIVFDRVRPDTLPARAPSISFAAGLPIEGLRVGAPAPSPGGFTQWDRTHPLMRYVALGDVALDGAREVVTTGLASGYVATPLAWAGQGPAVVLLERAGVRRLVVGIDLNATTWSKDVSFPTFVANAVDYLTLRGEDSGASWFNTTDPVALPAPVGTKAGDALAVIGPDGAGRAALVSDDAGLMVGVLPRVGLYRVGAVPIAVNLLDPTESRLRTNGSVDVGGRTAASDSAAALGAAEVWRWFVLAALAVLCVEWVLFAWRSRV